MTSIDLFLLNNLAMEKSHGRDNAVETGLAQI